MVQKRPNGSEGINSIEKDEGWYKGIGGWMMMMMVMMMKPHLIVLLDVVFHKDQFWQQFYS